MAKKSISERISRIDPSITLAQWTYDFLALWFPGISASFVAAGGMTVLAYLTEWAHFLGPLGLGMIGFITWLVAWIGLAHAQKKRSEARINALRLSKERDWLDKADLINPLDTSFHSKRISISEMRHPVSHRISGKSFANCQLIGPGNIYFHEELTCVGVSFVECDFIVVQPDRNIKNVTVFENTMISGGEICNATILLNASLLAQFSGMPGVQFLTLTGDPALDGAVIH